jgi:oxalate---CoA ligase
MFPETTDKTSVSTLAASLTQTARRAPRAAALLAPGRAALTYAMLEAQLAGVAQWLASAGHGRRSRVALALANGPELAVALLAVSRCMTCAPLNPALEEASLQRLLATMRIDALIAPARRDSAAVRAALRLGIPVIGLDAATDGPAGCLTLDGTVVELARGGVAPVAPEPDDVALLMHTSGTTAEPKIVPLTQRRLSESARSRIDLYALGPDDRCLLGMPLHTAAGVRRGLLLPLLAGGSLVCTERFEARQFVDLLEQYAATYYTAPAAAQVAILEELTCRPRPPRLALRFAETSGAPLTAATQRRLAEQLRVPVIIGYGITETGSIAQTPLPPIETPAGSVGLPTRMELRIRDDLGRDVGPRQVGEIQVRGAEVFDGYEGDARANAAAFIDGWFRTGDLGWLDERGFLFIAGRLKEVINRGGEKIVPSEVENVLAGHPAVAQAVAFALPHATLGEDLAAAVVARSPVTEEQLQAFARDGLAAFRVPTRIFVLPEIPKAALDKPKRGELARIAAELMQREFVAPATATELRLAAMYADLLQVDRIGARDSFLQLGGDSLRGARLLAKVQAEFGLALRLDVLYRHPTPAALAQYIDAALRPPAAEGPPRDVGTEAQAAAMPVGQAGACR